MKMILGGTYNGIIVNIFCWIWLIYIRQTQLDLSEVQSNSITNLVEVGEVK